MLRAKKSTAKSGHASEALALRVRRESFILEVSFRPKMRGVRLHRKGGEKS